LEIGRAGGSSSPGKYWKGQLDDVRIWNIARRGADISATFRNPIGGRPAGLVANWRFDETSGSAVGDSSGGHTGQLLGGASLAPAP
jgi:hypothetical protein